MTKKSKNNCHNHIILGIIMGGLGGIAAGLIISAFLALAMAGPVTMSVVDTPDNFERGSQSFIKPGLQPPSFEGYSELQPGVKRILLTPKSATTERELRSRTDVDIRHEFEGKFSANVPTAALSALEKLATVETVPIWQVNIELTPAAKPICGDGICQGNEPRTCPNDCPAEEPPEERSCFPTKQWQYNVLQVNGGQLGTGSGINVAVLDTGTTPKHPDLNVQLCKDATKRGIKNGCRDKSDVAHGTHSTGIVAATGGDDGLGIFGVAPSANLWAIKVCGNMFCFTDDIAAGINYAAEQGVDIINMSFGGSSESILVKEAIAAHPQILFVASAGNRGPDSNTISYPAANPKVIAIAAHDVNKVVARFSSRGIDDADDTTIVEREVEFSAGGVSVESTNKDGCYSSLSGTSFSAPTIAGLAAKVWQGNAANTRAFLVSITWDITQAIGGGAEAGFDIASGYGLPVAP